MVTWEPINISKVTRVVCDMEHWSWGSDNVFQITRGMWRLV
jgi:hypothetical protein